MKRQNNSNLIEENEQYKQKAQFLLKVTERNPIQRNPLFLTIGIIGIVIIITYGIYIMGRRRKSHLPSHSQPRKPIHLAQMTSPKFCFECGHNLPPNATFCTNCGKKLT